MNLFDILQLIGGLILTIGNIPQIVKILRTRSANDFQSHSFFLLALGTAFVETYAIHMVVALHAGTMFLITNTVSLFILTWLWLTILRYQKRQQIPQTR